MDLVGAGRGGTVLVVVLVLELQFREQACHHEPEGGLLREYLGRCLVFHPG